MARRRFFVPEIRRGLAELTGPTAEHLVRVLRVEVGQVYELSDNHALYLAEIELARKSAVTFRVLEKLPLPTPGVRISLFAALFKFDAFEWMVQKATELGVSAIEPWEAIRSERGLVHASSKRLARWQKLGNEASQQSRRLYLPDIKEIVRFAEILQRPAEVRLLLDEASEAIPVLTTLPVERHPTDHVALLLGPEGGWTPQERSQAGAAGWTACSLGQTILRAETAAVAALAVIQAAWAVPAFQSPNSSAALSPHVLADFPPAAS